MRDVVVTRVQYSGPRRKRNLEERLWVRFPRLYRRQAALVFGRLSPRSRLRRVVLRRALLSGWASFDRGDSEVQLMFYAPDAAFELPPGMGTLGEGEPFRGYEGRLEGLNKLAEVWGSSELVPAYIVDLGDRFLFVGFWRTRASASGVPLEQQVSQVIMQRDGLVTRDQIFFSWEEGLQAAGLEPDAIDLPSPAKAAEAAGIGR